MLWGEEVGFRSSAADSFTSDSFAADYDDFRTSAQGMGPGTCWRMVLLRRSGSESGSDRYYDDRKTCSVCHKKGSLSISTSYFSLIRAIGAFVLTCRMIRDVERISPALDSCRTMFRGIQEGAADVTIPRSSAKSRVASRSPRMSWTMNGHDGMEMMHFTGSMNWRCDSPRTCSISLSGRIRVSMYKETFKHGMQLLPGDHIPNHGYE
ncbi:Uncharacterized protein HZ326_19032 [Fusarium oxysporum f. sp. albedinis]|nr:Uncharacterized protein HZ326_19032 [Fusarium oxysporum f. sp. albedinis]